MFGCYVTPAPYFPSQEQEVLIQSEVFLGVLAALVECFLFGPNCLA